MNARVKRAITAVILAQGAPLGWLAFRWAGGGMSPREEILTTPGLYCYLFLSTSLIFAIFGYLLGKFEEQLARNNEEFKKLSRTDALTGLDNVRTLSEMLPRLVSYSHRTGTSLALVMLDVDRFKLINDRYGHLTGDELLRRLGRVLSEGRRREDIVARIGGEEFVIVLPGIDRLGAERVARRVLESVRNMEFALGGQPIGITVSAGVAQLQPQDDERGILARADAAMYDAKRAGRDRVGPGQVSA